MSTRLSLASTSIRSWAVLLVVGFALTACGGGGGGGGLGSDGPPAAPLGASVPASGSNPLNVVNSSNVAALFIDVVFGPESSSEHTVTVTIDDGGADGVVQATAQASEGAGTVSVGPMDLSSLDDGSLSVTAEVVSSQGSSGVIPMGTLAKQTTGYQTPIKSNVAALPSGQFPTGTAQLDVINSVNANQVTVAVEFGADSDSSLTAVLCLFDGVNTVSVPPFAAPEGAAIVNVGPLDATGLDEGSITLKVEITDGFGNPTTFPGDTAVKDTIVPTPSDVSVPSGDNNSEGWVNVATCNDATFLVHMPANSTFADLVTVNISDGSNIVTVGPLGSPAPKVGEQEQDTHEISFENVDLSSLSDGSLTITGQVEDDHGNLISFAHSPVSAGTPLPAKDTVAPTATSSLIAAGPNNPAGIINIASQSQVSVDVGVLGTSVVNGDSVEVTITDVASFVVKANGTATGPGSLTVGPIYTNTLFDGTVTIAVTMTDPAGNSTTGAASAGDKGTTAPGAPAAVSLLAGAMNGPNVVNGTNVSSANIDCDAGVGNDPSRSISFRAFLGASEVTQTASAPTGGATISFTGVDLASLPDGTLTLESWHTDGFGNESSRISTPVTKDVLPPATPTAAHIAASSSNPQGFINASSQGGVSVEVTFPATYAGTEICRITLSDSGSGVVNSGVFSPLPGGSTFTVGAINAASLADGSITIGVTATDWTGNQASYSIGAGTKDITGPAAPSSLAVAMTQQNAANIINGMTETAVEVAVNYDSSMTGTETAVLSLSGTDIPDQVLSPPTAVPSGGGMSLFTIDTDKITDGTVNVHIRINDVAGNATNFFGTAALKDTVFPAVPTSAAVIVGGSNPVNVINSASQASAQVDVGFGASSVATDLVALTMTSGTASLSWGPLSAPSGTGTLSFAGLDFSAGDTFPEGTVSIQISVQDINGNITTFAGTPATKDTFAPPPPTSFAINGTSDNPANFINSTTASSVQVTVGYSAAYAGDESMTVTLSDSGSGTASSPTFSPPAEGNSLTFIVDASSLADGAITLELLSADPAGNSAMFPGTPATKDVSAPAAATALAVAVTGSNPANVINSTTETAAQFDITYDGSMTGTETAILRLTGPTGGEPTTVEIGPIAVPASGGPFSWIADTSKLADGAMILQIQITDPSGNKTTFTGTGATKDTAAPASVTGAFVAAGGMNAVNVINSNSVGAVQVDVSFDSSSVATDTVTVTLTQGASMVTTGSMAAPAGAGTLNFTAINTSALTEGLVTVTVDVVDTNLNTSTTPGTAALKDTQAAAAPTASFIVQGANNPANVINSNNSAAVQVQVDYPASWDGNVTAQVELVDSGSGTASSAALSPSSAGTTITFSVNASSLADGAITVQVVTTDENQNAMTYAGTAATMDTAPPVAPSALAIASGGSNPADVINIATETSYQVDVTYDGSMAGTELAFLHVTGVKGDGTTTDTFGPFAVPASGGPASFAGLSSIHFADGAVTLAIDVFDAAGNPVTFAGTAGLKDTVAPPAPTLAVVPSGGSNPANFINIATVANFQVDVTWDSAADGTATAIVTVEDGSNPVVSGSMAVSPSSTVVYGSLDASLVVQGSHVIRVDVTDPNQNLTTFTGTPVVADTIAPTAPSALQVAAGSGNDAQIINLLNVGNVTMDVTYHSSMVGDEMALITLTSGASAMSALTAVPASGGAAQISGIDVTALTDGTLAVAMSIDVTDPAGNTTNFAGPANATKDTTPPVAASSAGVVDSGGSVNPPNYVNMASDAIVAVDVGMAAGALVGDEVTITLTGGAMMVSPTPFTLVAPGVQTVSFTAIDLSLFPDGPITIAVSVEDPNRNPATSVGTPAIKDVVPPALPTFAGISATGQNPVNFVNLASQNTVEVLVTFAATSLSTDVVTVNITDIGVGNMNYGPTNATDGTGDLVFVNQDFSSLMDGALTVNITVADLAGNSANGLGSAATKDTAAPTAPTAFLVAAGGMNAINVVNSFSGAAVQLDVTYHASTAGDETVQLTITSGGGGAFMLTPPTPPAGASTQMYTGNDFVGAGVLDGALTLNGTFTDPAGNATPFTGTAAIMDTAPPILPTGASVIAGGMNAADVINMFNQASAQVDVAFGTFDTNDQVTLTLTDMGSTPLVVGPVASAALVSFATINTSTLVEGPITVDIMIQDQYGNPVSTFSGTGAIKDVTPPTLPSAAILPSGPGNNLGWVSGASVASVLARVSLTASSVNTDTVDLTIDDNITTVMTGPQAAPNGAGDVDFSSINLSALVDGVIDLNVTVADQYGNTATTTINANQDVVDPTGVTASQVAMGGSNPADFINLASQATTVVSVTYDGTADANDRAIATLSDGSNMVSTLEITATPSSTATSAAFDTTSLNEASISISLALYDLAGNTGSASGSAATKDITLPQTPIVDPVTSPTNETTVNITGVSEIQNVIDVVGGAATGMGTADNNGAWVVAWAPPASATTALSVTATDPAGNPSSPTTIDWKSATLSITQDATAPDVPFADDTVPAGLGDTGAVGGGSFIDVDNDTDLDLFVGDTGKLYQNDGNGVFTDITATVGVLFTGDRSAVWADYDNDGDLDLFTTHTTLGSFLFQNDIVGLGTLTFSDATAGAAAGLGGDLRGATWFDYNGDGYIDVMAADADGFGNELLRNDGATPTFTGIFGSGLDPELTSPQWVTIGDLDANGGIDLIIGDSTPGLMYMNDGAGNFTDNAGGGGSGFITDTSVTEGGIALCDIDNDGDQDIFVCSGAAGATNQLWQNDGAGNFTDVAPTAGVDPAASAYDVAFGDFNHDGLVDIYLACNGANVLYLNQGDQVGSDGIPEFVNVAAQVGGVVNDAGNAQLVTAGDVDGDGDLEIFVGNESQANIIYSNGIDNSNWLKVKLVGKGGANSGSTVDAIGAQVRIEDSATTTDVAWRWVQSGRGAGGDEPKTLHFGGLIPSRPYNVHITWPTGATQTISNTVAAVLTGQTLTVVEP